MGLLDFAGKVVGDVVKGAEHSAEDVLKGGGKVLGGAADFAKGLAKGNLSEAFGGVKEMGKGGFDAFSGAKDLTELASPEGLAANVLLDGAKEGIKSLPGQNNATA
ncbi:hypothetical protein FAZ69_32355 [Trinickia terrae]|uniref:Uncharacterized protein n=1 Tax=Trinickia terrae TaxID=2571161 RepID=A0A4U1HB24_9BURK|nr:hypothetical protein [Trinickia terrae]TKC77971.1 hypothetical protein FAZ69_32355 [Trinickia terrae]